METEVIVVGAGPAGSTAARELAARGIDVLLLDRARFPRDKPCGGGVTIQCASLLPFPLDPVIEDVTTGALIRGKRGRDAVREAGVPLAYMTQRTRLDHYLVERAQEAGAHFRDATPVRRIEAHRDGFTVRAGDEMHSARVVLGADGANGVTRTFLGYEHAAENAVALEGMFPTPDGPPPWLRGKIALHLGAMPGGYGWLFPKGDHINVGVGGWKSVVGPRLRDDLQTFARGYGLDPAALVNIRGHHLPMRRRGAVLAHGGSALLGDAAGLVDPLSGEGIHAAIHSGVAVAPEVQRYLAGETRSLASYEQVARREILREVETSQALMEIFHAFPGPCVWALQHSGRVWRSSCSLVRGEQSYEGIVGRFGPLSRTLGPVAALSKRITTRRYGRRFGRDE